MKVCDALLRGHTVLAGFLIAAGCGHAPDRRPIDAAPPQLDDEQRARARAEFADLAADYERAARGPLSEATCADFAKRFTALYERYGAEMTVAWFNAGAVWDQCGDTTRAEKVYQAIVTAEPTFDLAYNNLGVILWDRRDEAGALRLFERAVAVNPQTRAPRNNLAAALRNQYAASPGDQAFDAAEDHLKNVLAVDSNNRKAFENLARLYYDRGRLQDASYLLLAELVVTQAHRVLEGSGERSADLYNLQGLLLIERGNYVEALRSFKQAVEIEPNHADAHMNIAMIALEFRDYAQAHRSIHVALEDPRQRANVEAWLGLGVALRGLRNFAEAENAFAHAAKLDRGDPRALYNLGILQQEHVAPAQIDKDGGKKGNRVARRYFSEFVERAGTRDELKPVVADARARMKSIDDYLEALRVGDEIEKEVAEAERIQAEEKRRERERLLELERRALEHHP